MGVNSLPKTVIRQRRGCNLNPGPSAPESSTLTTQLYRATHSCIHAYIVIITVKQLKLDPVAITLVKINVVYCLLLPTLSRKLEHGATEYTQPINTWSPVSTP